MTASREMPKYQCHKQVWALKIKTVAVHASGDTAVSDAEFQASDAFQGAHLITVEDGYAPFHVSADWFRKHKPEAGGYYVVYEDGYKSYSPASAFESGYSLIPPASTHQQRVLDEKRELDERLSKLDAFILDNPLFLQLSGSEQERLARQSKAMAIYSGILGERIAHF